MQFSPKVQGAAVNLSDLVDWGSNRKFKLNVGRIKHKLRDNNADVFELAKLLAQQKYQPTDRIEAQTRLLTEMLGMLQGQNKHQECAEIVAISKNAHPSWEIILPSKTELRRFGALQF